MSLNLYVNESKITFFKPFSAPFQLTFVCLALFWFELMTSADCCCRYLLLRTHQLPLDAFLVALNMMQVEDVDLDEVQCILANLIYMVSSYA